MVGSAKGIICGVIEWVKCNTLSGLGHVERIQDRDFTRSVYGSEIKGVDVRGRTPVTWGNKQGEK